MAGSEITRPATGPARGLRLGGRAAMLVGGSLISTSCYALTIRARMGLGPLYVLQDGLARVAGISIGHAVMVVGIGLVAVAAALRSWPGPGTLILPFLGGAALDAMLPSVPVLHGTIVRLAAVVLATWVMALGGALIIRASVGVAAYDAVMLGLLRILRASLGPVRLGMEAAALVMGWALGGAVGLGTVITGVLIGPGLQFWLRVLGGRPVPPRRAALPSGGAPSWVQ